MLRAVLVLAVLAQVLAFAAPAKADAAGEYAKHLGPLAELSIAVAEAMPGEQYGFRPHPESMNFGELMAHIATTNYQFCASLKDTAPPTTPAPSGKSAIVNFLRASFEYCSTVIPKLTEAELAKVHNSPDGQLPGRDVLLAMYNHVSNHRGKEENNLRDKGIKPPSYKI